MPRSTRRRRFLGLVSTGILGTVVGCIGDDDDGTQGETEPTSMGEADAADAAAGDDEMGFTPGGAQDVGDFRNNIEEGYLPVPESLSYEGLFSEYYFDTGGDGDGCESLFCAAYSSAVSADPLSDRRERFFTVGLDSGRSLDEFERPNVNLVVVVDVSGSMDSPFDRYYYDPETGEEVEVDIEDQRPKMAVANDALVTLTEQLGPGDRLGIVEFESSADVVHGIQDVGETDMAALRDEIRSISAGGGTDIEDGIETGLDQLDAYRNAASQEYENRIVVVTDAQPNLGDTTTDGLRGTLESAAADGLHTSFVGVGLDFNPTLVDRITSIRGANYYTVRSPSEFRTRMGEEFSFMVTPLVFDLSVELAPGTSEILQVYGSSVDDAATESVLSVPTLFPSPQEDGETKGGVVLVQVDDVDAAEPPVVEAAWETRAGEQRSETATVTFPASDGDAFANDGVRKAVVLARYGDLLRNWMIHEREQDLVETEDGIDVPPETERGRWEQRSEDLRVTDPYDERIDAFRQYYEAEREAIGDDDLEQELEVMATILDAA